MKRVLMVQEKKLPAKSKGRVEMFSKGFFFLS